ncbi:hypothetical protein WJ0W_001265 [Paenibacillus melissococcoides]|uniref:Ankyrin repeat domain-containing protein n=1 Tax=Paenibacillus melissococcoides TaxID=2912268 RepID=A0ABN8U417_9BACL|nr:MULTISPECIES: hypothetical protein [Paenibacillus]MEB9895756.1 hypothetical protein [Bacillus cereus]CAH8244026.1 hypothetical protein WJ0W_001265 [Paenibacillus melissococcoides]CAH8704004.1 hypothetical protein HTL2_000393 [Paenibacillus melissococcoides]CAH8706665.1 hypothetical protein WDD9_001355 [Paenibacillus melissococcoides]GIO80186.1 hypothetical protein J6TS7_37960 [Paenibacillus dendritiformis]
MGPDHTDCLFGRYAAADKQAVLEMLNHEPSLLTSLSDDDRRMLLEFAEFDKAEAVKLMLETGFDSSIQREEGTALHIAGMAWTYRQISKRSRLSTKSCR